MPLYEFVCKKCGTKFEKLLPVGTEITDCPNCRKSEVTKIFSMFAAKSGGKMIASGGCSSCATSSCDTCK